MTDKLSYQPKGGMCAKCEDRLKDCSHLDFKNMPVIMKFETTVIVRCTHRKQLTIKLKTSVT